jgi:acetyl-CoA synthetase
MRGIHLQYVKETYRPDGTLESYKLVYPDSFNFGYDVVDEIAEKDPERVAMVWNDPTGDERIFTFADMKRLSDKTANYLKSLGIGKGDFVMVVLKRNYEFWYVATALHKLGAVLVPATFMLKKHDVEYRVNSARIKAVIVTTACDAAEAVDEALPDCPTLATRIVVRGEREGWDCFEKGLEAASEDFKRVETHVQEPMIMYFSSGTTGYPKMVLHDHSYALAHLFTAKHWHNVDPEGLHFTIADTGWGKAVWGKLYGQWLMEAAVLTYDFDKFVPREILNQLQKYRVTTFCVPPTMYRLLLHEDVGSFDLSALKYCTTAGEAMAPEVFKAWKRATGVSVMEGFGQTETTVVICNTRGMTPKPGSLGRPSPQYQVALMDPDGDPCPMGVTGEIVIAMKYGKPAGLLESYYLDEEKTAEAFRKGWYHTGDTAWMDEDGYYWYVGRNDDIIKSSGYRIGPFEIESVLIEHPAVAECAVTGVPDPVRGQLVKATIVLFPNYEPSDELAGEIQEYVKQRTAPYKYPRVISFVKALPKTVNGKLRRVAIREDDTKKDA